MLTIFASGLPEARCKAPTSPQYHRSYLKHCGHQICTEKSFIAAFTLRSMNNYPVLISGHRVPLTSKYMFLGVAIDRGLTWTPHVACLKKLAASNRPCWNYLGSQLGFPVASPSTALYGNPSLLSPCGQHASACLGLPKCTSTTGTIAEARSVPITVCQIQETICMYLRHWSQYSGHHLAALKLTDTYSE